MNKQEKERRRKNAASNLLIALDPEDHDAQDAIKRIRKKADVLLRQHESLQEHALALLAQAYSAGNITLYRELNNRFRYLLEGYTGDDGQQLS